MGFCFLLPPPKESRSKSGRGEGGDDYDKVLGLDWSRIIMISEIRKPAKKKRWGSGNGHRGSQDEGT